MIRKILVGITFLAFSFCLTLPLSMPCDAATDTEEAVPYGDVYLWYYKEVDGVKYMRLWDTINHCWVTNWIPVQS